LSLSQFVVLLVPPTEQKISARSLCLQNVPTFLGSAGMSSRCGWDM